MHGDDVPDRDAVLEAVAAQILDLTPIWYQARVREPGRHPPTEG
jgi:hypothetical protein